MKYPKDYAPLVEAAVAAGWTHVAQRNGHTRLIHPDGERYVVLPSSSVSNTGLLNTRARLRRAGLAV